MKKSLLFLFLLVWAALGAAQVAKKDLANRRYEPVVVSMKDFTAFHEKLVKNLFLYAYDDTVKNWRAVPFQIDDRNSGGHYNFDVPADTLDEYDELVFMLKDMGDRVPDGYWLADSVSRNLSRYEIEIEDTLWQHQKAWVYLFCSNTISDFVAEDYLDYIDSVPDNMVWDKIVSKYYEVDFWEQNGLPIHTLISMENNGAGIDFLDRIKFRIQVGDIKLYGIPYNEPLNVTEENIFRDSIKVIDSRVRIIRDMKVKIIVDAFGVYTYEDSSNFPISFYPYNYEIQSDNINLDTSDLGDVEMNIKLIRYSMDFNDNANGMNFYNNYNRYEPEDMDNRNRINGMGGPNILDHRLDVPGLNWFLVSGAPGSIFSTTTVPDIGDAQMVYFYDYDYDSGPQTWDGTPDTGDKASWGDSGIRINGKNIQGDFSIISNTYCLPANEPVEIGDTLNANIEQPVVIKLTPQNFDLSAPAKIVDLAAVSAYDTTVTLNWTAPGDDSTSGTARYYDVRYSAEAPVEGAEAAWFENIADTVAGEPAPSVAGTEETMSISGLQPGQTYYFAVRAYDEADVNDGSGNGSPVSNIAGTVTLNVELAAFSAVATGNSVLLSWRTVGEENNLGFELQRKTDVGTYEKITFIPGNGTTSAPYDYSYRDNSVTGGIYYYRLKQIDADGTFRFYNEIKVAVALPRQFALHQNYPNPFNPTTTVSYDLARDSEVRLVVFNAKGQIMQVLVDGNQPAGRYKEKISASNWPSGIYFVRLIAGKRIFVKKIILLE